jgi:ubiquinone/menaquinone biosynthesis C-methylase UbiE
MPPAPISLGMRIDVLGRTLRATGPAPRGLPHLWLEHASGTGAHLLGRLSTHGIFRKYEHVLDLGGGLGGVGRWLALRLGCTAVTTAPTVDVAAWGALLTRRAALEGSVHHLPARSDALPLATASFTHVWVVESLATMPRPEAALAEAFRVLRPGGHLAVQELVGSAGVAGYGFVDAAERARQLAAAGLVEVTMRDVTREAAERVAHIVAARSQLERALGDEPAARTRRALAAGLQAGDLGVVQLLARRP